MNFNQLRFKLRITYYVIINRFKDNCLPLDKVEQAKCEEHFESQGHSDYETKRLIMKNCPCHYNCYNSGCANCGGWECPNSDSHIDAATGKDSKRNLEIGNSDIQSGVRLPDGHLARIPHGAVKSRRPLRRGTLL